MIQSLVRETNGRSVAVAQSIPCQVWIGHLEPANDGLGGPLVFVAAATMDESCQTVIRELREEAEESAIVALCTGELEQKMLALRAGADDCIAVPDAFIDALKLLDIIGARMNRMTSRGGGSHRVTANPLTHEVTVNGNTIFATPLEFRLLLELQKQRGQVVAHKHLESLLWGTSDALSRQALKQLARRLRRRLGPGNESVVLVRGVGYMLT
jgi:two-component system response regulator BasR